MKVRLSIKYWKVVIELKKLFITLCMLIAFAIPAMATEAPKTDIVKPVIEKKVKKDKKPVLKNVSTAKVAKKK